MSKIEKTDAEWRALLAAKKFIIIGLIAGPVCYVSSVWIKKLLRYDDSLDAFGIHGAGGGQRRRIVAVLGHDLGGGIRCVFAFNDSLASWPCR